MWNIKDLTFIIQMILIRVILKYSKKSTPRSRSKRGNVGIHGTVLPIEIFKWNIKALELTVQIYKQV